MGKITIEVDDKVLAKALAAAMPSDDDSDSADEKPTRRSKAGKPTGKRGSASLFKKEEMKKLADKYKSEFSAAELKELLEDVADCTSITKVSDDQIDAVIDELKAELEDSEEEDGDESEVDAEAVKIAVQAFQKKNGKEETEEILEEYGIKSVRSLNKLDQEQLEDLFADVTAG